MQQGTVKWFNDSKGFGFIAPEGGGKDIFVHFNDISGRGHRTLHEGQKVEFDTEDTPRGLKAVMVAPVNNRHARSSKTDER